MLAILIPSRQRPEQFARMVESVRITSSKPVKIFLCITPEEYESYKPHVTNDMVVIFQPDNMPTAQKWNLLAQIAMKDESLKLFMLGSDDMYFTTPLWNEALISTGKPHVYALQDSRDENGTPHPIMTREWIEALGYFVPPIFLHWFIDSWAIEIAKYNNCFTHLKDYLLVHDKLSDKGEGDETHNKIRQSGWRERDQYVDGKMRHLLQIEKERLACAFG